MLLILSIWACCAVESRLVFFGVIFWEAFLAATRLIAASMAAVFFKAACLRCKRAVRACLRRSRRAAWAVRRCSATAAFCCFSSADQAWFSKGSICMHSTGQGSMHSWQPVHSSMMTVCICLAAPRMASTGQACMQRVQPIQACSSMNACFFT